MCPRFIDKNDLKKRYLNQHRINPKNHFLMHYLKETMEIFHYKNVIDATS